MLGRLPSRRPGLVLGLRGRDRVRMTGLRLLDLEGERDLDLP